MHYVKGALGRQSKRVGERKKGRQSAGLRLPRSSTTRASPTFIAHRSQAPSMASVKLSSALKALVGAPHAQGAALPAPPRAAVTQLFERLATSAAAHGVGDAAWLTLGVRTYTLSRPCPWPSVYRADPLAPRRAPPSSPSTRPRRCASCTRSRRLGYSSRGRSASSEQQSSPPSCARPGSRASRSRAFLECVLLRLLLLRLSCAQLTSFHGSCRPSITSARCARNSSQRSPSSCRPLRLGAHPLSLSSSLSSSTSSVATLSTTEPLSADDPYLPAGNRPPTRSLRSSRPPRRSGLRSTRRTRTSCSRSSPSRTQTCPSTSSRRTTAPSSPTRSRRPLEDTPKSAAS